MDPNVETQHGDFRHDSHQAEAGADYLRRLKAQAGEDAIKQPSDTTPAETASPVFKERRRSPRFQCSGSAEVHLEESEGRVWGTLTDVSLHGCYVEMHSTFPVGTIVSLVLEALGIRVRAKATVRVSYPFLGMGLCFSEIEPDQHIQLEQLLAATSRHGSRLTTNSNPPVPPSSLAEIDPMAMLQQLTQFFSNNQLLTREEFYRIARRAAR